MIVKVSPVFIFSKTHIFAKSNSDYELVFITLIL